MSFLLEDNVLISSIHCMLPKPNNDFRRFNNQLKSDVVQFRYKNITFCGNSSKSVMDFEKKVLAKKITLLELLKKSIVPENLLGEGLNSKVYSVLGVDDYVVKTDKKKFLGVNSITNKIFTVEDDFEGKNMGQVIGKINDGIFILKKQKGKEHSVKFWSDYCADKLNVTEKDAHDFIKDIKKIAKMPDKTYEDYADKIQYLAGKGYKTDSINPNNLLIDYEKNEINIIDFFKASEAVHKDSVYDMFCPLLDFSLYKKYHGFLNEKDKKELVNSSKVIIDKCFKAAEKKKLPTDENTYINFITEVDKWFGCHLPGGDYRYRYKNLKEILD